MLPPINKSGVRQYCEIEINKPACKESSVRKPVTHGYCCWASEVLGGHLNNRRTLINPAHQIYFQLLA